MAGGTRFCGVCSRVLFATFLFQIIVLDVADSDCRRLVAQESSGLTYVPASADAVLVIRPSQIMRSEDFRNLRRKSASTIDFMVGKLTDPIFRMSGVEIEGVNQIVYASRIPSDDRPTNAEFYSITVIKSLDESAEQFEMVTQSVANTLEHKGKQYFETGRHINGHRFVYIADAHTIIWSTTSQGIQEVINTGEKGPESAVWYSLWKEQGDKPVSVAIDIRSLRQAPLPPPFSELKSAKQIAGGAILGNKVKLTVSVECGSSGAASQLVEAGEKMLEQGELALQAAKQRLKQSDPRDASETQEMLKSIELADEFLDATEITCTRDRVDVKAEIEIDWAEIVPLLEIRATQSVRMENANNLRQIALAMHNYESAFQSFPPAVLIHPSGKKYSWRIAILPFLEEQALYDEYRFDESWDSPHNKRVTQRMPAVFRNSITADEDTTESSFFLVTGPGTLFDGENGLRFQNITDGTSNTIFAVEAKLPIHWAEPKDLPFDENISGRLGGYTDEGFHVGFGDGSVMFIRRPFNRDELHKFFTISGGEVVNRSDLTRKK